MDGIRIVSDSTCNLPQELVERYHITIVPVNIQLGGKSYLEGIEITPELFYRELEAGAAASTSQPSPGQFVAVYQSLLEEASAIISIHVTAKSSGTYQSAMMAREMMPGADITVVDSASISMGTGFQVLAAARAVEEGKDKGEILALVERIKARVNIYATVATLKYLQQSGRVGRLQSALASMLDVKPVVTIVDGALEMVEKVRTRSRALERVLALTTEASGQGRRAKVAVLHAQVPQEGEWLREQVEQRIECQELFFLEAALSLAVHGGPGVIGIISYRV
ncbi:MAG: DegV family protein [Anaerolineae bacterium]